jgi:release factor glutamine methyltransferase
VSIPVLYCDPLAAFLTAASFSRDLFLWKVGKLLMKSIKSLLLFAVSQLGAVENARLDAEILLAFMLQVERTHLWAWPEKEVTLAQEKSFEVLVKRRVSGEPIAYMLGHKEFWGLTLKVNQHTLIPRPETELLVELVFKKFGEKTQLSVLDLGTGSGAIALALASEKPAWKITALDNSSEALAVAKSNAQDHALSNVAFVCSDWCSTLGLTQRFDVIVSNPPYIDAQDHHLDALNFEPRSALVAEKNGLQDFEKICEGAKLHLKENGLLLFEHGFEQGDAVQALLKANDFHSIETVNDLAGLARVTMGQLSPMSVNQE